jgi:hypothetical protein
VKPLRVGVNLLWLVPGEVGGSEEMCAVFSSTFGEIDTSRLELTFSEQAVLGPIRRSRTSTAGGRRAGKSRRRIAPR